MIRLKQLAGFLLVCLVGSAVGWIMNSAASTLVNSIILQAFGGFSALATTCGLQVMRRLDDPPVKYLTEKTAERLRHIYQRKKVGVRVKWAIAFFCGSVGMALGVALKSPELAGHSASFVVLGYAAVLAGVVNLCLMFVDYWALSRMTIAIPNELTARQKRSKTLQRLRPRSERSEPRATSVKG